MEGLKAGDQVVIRIDKDVRVRHAKLHSAGHLIDLAVQKLGNFISKYRIWMVDCQRVPFRRRPLCIIQSPI